MKASQVKIHQFDNKKLNVMKIGTKMFKVTSKGMTLLQKPVEEITTVKLNYE